MEWLRQELKRLEFEGLYRQRILRDGLKDFCSNDYLALRDHPQVLEESALVLRSSGLGSGASPLVSGYTLHHKRLEEKLAEFKGLPRCLLFGSGYMANLGALQALAGEGDVLFSDELNHASIVDACRLSRAKTFVFRHLDYLHLQELLSLHRKDYRRCLIVSDTLFSMEGDVAHVPTLKRLCEEYDCMLYLDEAHATGVLGAEGRGGLEAFGESWQEYIVLMGTLSKAIGSYGAFVCGSQELCEYLVNKARSLIFSTALPPAVCAGATKAVELIQRESWRVQKLREVSWQICQGLKDAGLEVSCTGTPIIPLMVYQEKRAVRIREWLLEQGILLQAIRYPAVPKGRARLRVTASLRYSREDMSLLVETLKSLPSHLRKNVV
ncbi:MAG: 8-amino-7-oxononanoate synthase [Aquificaceae bacterium]|nr:8-amino-7-oxononanoate synthase [Aquificaceae bacterium]MDW8096760.1 8-amino-7-oxononanoate synthase [Aquificaceae bacterium]